MKWISTHDILLFVEIEAQIEVANWRMVFG